MDEDQGRLLHSDILEKLGHRHYDSPAYQLFKELLYDGGDPMEFRDYLVKVQKACKGALIVLRLVTVTNLAQTLFQSIQTQRFQP